MRKEKTEKRHEGGLKLLQSLEPSPKGNGSHSKVLTEEIHNQICGLERVLCCNGVWSGGGQESS